MSEYVILMKLTDKGWSSMADCQQWVARWKTGWENYGGAWGSFHITAGDYDCVLVGQAESDDHAAAFAMWLGQEGFVRTSIMRAWSPDYMVQWAPGGSRGHPK